MEQADADYLEDYAELYSSVECHPPGHREMRRKLKYSGPMLILDFFHVFPGEPVSIRDIPSVLARNEGIYKVLLFDADDIERHIRDITAKLSENDEHLGKWKVVFTRPSRYKGYYDFRRFMEESGGKAKEIIFL